ncbi:phospholipase [Micromonospora sp. MP36]|nr:phospholipase [Micromonospora sp. MP36]
MPGHQPLGPSESGSVVFDPSGDSGALIVHSGRELHGCEKRDQSGRRAEYSFRRCGTPGRGFHSAVDPAREASRYTVWWDDRTPAGAVSVTGRAVAEFVWPTSAPPGSG